MKITLFVMALNIMPPNIMSFSIKTIRKAALQRIAVK